MNIGQDFIKLANGTNNDITKEDIALEKLERGEEIKTRENIRRKEAEASADQTMATAAEFFENNKTLVLAGGALLAYLLLYFRK